MQTSQQQAEQAASWLGCDVEELMDAFSLDSIISSRNTTMPPQRIVIYGTPGIGKTTFAGTFPAPILMRFEDGAAALDIPTFPKLFRSLSDLNKGIKTLKGNHAYKTLIIDSLDWMEPLVWEYTCMKHEGDPERSIEQFGYGKGYIHADVVWRNIQAEFEKLRIIRGMNIICIAHAVPVTVDPPDMDPYQRYSLKLHKRGTALWMEWADMILFVNYRTTLIKNAKDKNAKSKAIGNGDRVIYTREKPAYQAKSRWPLDEEIFIGNDQNWSAFHENLNNATGGAYHVHV
jgi:hypothetical protein